MQTVPAAVEEGQREGGGGGGGREREGEGGRGREREGERRGKKKTIPPIAAIALLPTTTHPQ